jgi:hypothetical protein
MCRKVEAAAEDKKASDIVRRINEIQGAASKRIGGPLVRCGQIIKQPLKLGPFLGG